MNKTQQKYHLVICINKIATKAKMLILQYDISNLDPPTNKKLLTCQVS